MLTAQTPGSGHRTVMQASTGVRTSQTVTMWTTRHRQASSILDLCASLDRAPAVNRATARVRTAVRRPMSMGWPSPCSRPET